MSAGKGKGKPTRKSPSLDMTAMTDVAFLLLTFFILTTKFKPEEAVMVDTPTSVSETKIAETDILTLLVDKEGAIHFGMDNQLAREKVVSSMLKYYNVQGMTEAALKEFTLDPTFGLPIQAAPKYYSLKPEERKKVTLTGIPADSANNQLYYWITYTANAYKSQDRNPRLAIKGDRDADYETVSSVLNTLSELNISKFNFITNVEAKPE